MEEHMANVAIWTRCHYGFVRVPVDVWYACVIGLSKQVAELGLEQDLNEMLFRFWGAMCRCVLHRNLLLVETGQPEGFRVDQRIYVLRWFELFAPLI